MERFASWTKIRSLSPRVGCHCKKQTKQSKAKAEMLSWSVMCQHPVCYSCCHLGLLLVLEPWVCAVKATPGGTGGKKRRAGPSFKLSLRWPWGSGQCSESPQTRWCKEVPTKSGLFLEAPESPAFSESSLTRFMGSQVVSGHEEHLLNSTPQFCSPALSQWA